MEQNINYVIWRWEMWLNGFGTYDDIDWAVAKGLLLPIQSRTIRWVVKMVIKVRHYFTYRNIREA